MKQNKAKQNTHTTPSFEQDGDPLAHATADVKNKVNQIAEVFSDWEKVFILHSLEENEFDVDKVIAKRLEGRENWVQVKKQERKKKKKNDDFENPQRSRDGARGGRGGHRGGRGGRGRSSYPRNDKHAPRDSKHHENEEEHEKVEPTVEQPIPPQPAKLSYSQVTQKDIQKKEKQTVVATPQPHHETAAAVVVTAPKEETMSMQPSLVQPTRERGHVGRKPRTGEKRTGPHSKRVTKYVEETQPAPVSAPAESLPAISYAQALANKHEQEEEASAQAEEDVQQSSGVVLPGTDFSSNNLDLQFGSFENEQRQEASAPTVSSAQSNNLPNVQPSSQPPQYAAQQEAQEASAPVLPEPIGMQQVSQHPQQQLPINPYAQGWGNAYNPYLVDQEAPHQPTPTGYYSQQQQDGASKQGNDQDSAKQQQLYNNNPYISYIPNQAYQYGYYPMPHMMQYQGYPLQTSSKYPPMNYKVPYPAQYSGIQNANTAAQQYPYGAVDTSGEEVNTSLPHYPLQYVHGQRADLAKRQTSAQVKSSAPPADKRQDENYLPVHPQMPSPYPPMAYNYQPHPHPHYYVNMQQRPQQAKNSKGWQ